jgi:hypothetical protein
VAVHGHGERAKNTTADPGEVGWIWQVRRRAGQGADDKLGIALVQRSLSNSWRMVR